MRGVENVPGLYDAFMAVVEATGFAAWRRRLIRGVVGPTLEVGCGTGRNLPLYDRRTAVVGLDPSLEMLLKARQRSSGPLVLGRVESLPFRRAAFSTVVSALVFCSVGDPFCGIGEIRRVLRPGGTLRMLEHVRSEGRLRSRWQDLIQPVWTWVAGGCHPNRSTESVVSRGGFVIEQSTRRASGSMRLFAAAPDVGSDERAGAADSNA